MPAKIEQVCQRRRRGMTFSPMFGKASQDVILSPLNGHVTEVVSSMEGE